METPIQSQAQNNFNLKQREALAKLLTQAKERAQVELNCDNSAVSEAEAEAIPKLAEEFGASKLVENVRQLRKETDQAESALRKIGFECDDEGNISVRWSAPKNLKRAVETVRNAARKERDKILNQFDLAIVKVWAAEDAQEARRVAEGILER